MDANLNEQNAPIQQHNLISRCLFSINSASLGVLHRDSVEYCTGACNTMLVEP